MNKLQAYFDYFNKYRGVENFWWYKNLRNWLDIAAQIKSAIVSDAEISKRSIEETNHIISYKSDGEIKDIDGFFDRFLFYKDNELGILDKE